MHHYKQSYADVSSMRQIDGHINYHGVPLVHTIWCVFTDCQPIVSVIHSLIAQQRTARMWLDYGLNPSGELVHISVMPRGRSSLVCPYCHVPLIAKKGTRIEHHFAHAGETCNPAQRNEQDFPILPFTKFLFNVSAKEVKALHEHRSHRRNHTEYLEARKFIVWNSYRHEYEYTKKAQIVFGSLSVGLFCPIHEQAILDKAQQLDQQLEKAWQSGDAVAIQQCLADVQIYRTQWQHYLSTNLYVLEIQLENRTIYKIGQTTRPIAERMAEIRADVAAIEPVIGIKVIDVFPQRGHVEWYCKHRFAGYRVELGDFTEYFSFDEDWISVRRELRRMPKKVLSSIGLTQLAT